MWWGWGTYVFIENNTNFCFVLLQGGHKQSERGSRFEDCIKEKEGMLVLTNGLWHVISNNVAFLQVQTTKQACAYTQADLRFSWSHIPYYW